MIGLVGGAVDYARLVSARSQVQHAADSGVMSGGNALKLVVSDTARRDRRPDHQTIQDQLKASTKNPVTIKVDVAADKTSVTATVEQTIPLMFGPFVGMSSLKGLGQGQGQRRRQDAPVHARPRSDRYGRFCPAKERQVTAYDCALYSNSSDKSGMVGSRQRDGPRPDDLLGGWLSEQQRQLHAQPQTGCPVIPDPLRDRPTPQIGQCTLLSALLKIVDAATGPSKGVNVPRQ